MNLFLSSVRFQLFPQAWTILPFHCLFVWKRIIQPWILCEIVVVVVVVVDVVEKQPYSWKLVVARRYSALSMGIHEYISVVHVVNPCLDNQLWFLSFTRLFSSPQPKARVSFSDQNLSVVYRRRCCCRKLFTYSSSSPELLQGQFQPNLAQSILGWRLDYSNEGPFLFPWGDNYEC